MTQQNLIRYPALDYDSEDGWRDTGEGGQFFYAVWDNAQREECIVDVAPTLHMADVLVAASGPLASRLEDQKRGWYTEVDSNGYEHAYAASGITFDTVLLLGSTGISYYWGDYFALRSLDDLTEAGRALVQAISAVTGTEPTFLSYLDT